MSGTKMKKHMVAAEDKRIGAFEDDNDAAPAPAPVYRFPPPPPPPPQLQLNPDGIAAAAAASAAAAPVGGFLPPPPQQQPNPNPDGIDSSRPGIGEGVGPSSLPLGDDFLLFFDEDLVGLAREREIDGVDSSSLLGFDGPSSLPLDDDFSLLSDEALVGFVREPDGGDSSRPGIDGLSLPFDGKNDDFPLPFPLLFDDGLEPDAVPAPVVGFLPPQPPPPPPPPPQQPNPDGIAWWWWPDGIAAAPAPDGGFLPPPPPPQQPNPDGIAAAAAPVGGFLPPPPPPPPPPQQPNPDGIAAAPAPVGGLPSPNPAGIDATPALFRDTSNPQLQQTASMLLPECESFSIGWLPKEEKRRRGERKRDKIRNRFLTTEAAENSLPHHPRTYLPLLPPGPSILLTSDKKAAKKAAAEAAERQEQERAAERNQSVDPLAMLPESIRNIDWLGMRTPANRNQYYINRRGQLRTRASYWYRTTAS